MLVYGSYLNGLVEVRVGDLAVGSGGLLLNEVDLAEVHGEAGGVEVLPIGHGPGQVLVVVHQGHEPGLDEAVEAVQVVPKNITNVVSSLSKANDSYEQPPLILFCPSSICNNLMVSMDKNIPSDGPSNIEHHHTNQEARNVCCA